MSTLPTQPELLTSSKLFAFSSACSAASCAVVSADSATKAASSTHKEEEKGAKQACISVENNKSLRRLSLAQQGQQQARGKNTPAADGLCAPRHLPRLPQAAWHPPQHRASFSAAPAMHPAWPGFPACTERSQRAQCASPSTRLRMNLAGEPAQTWPLGMTVPGGTSAPAATTVRLSTCGNRQAGRQAGRQAVCVKQDWVSSADAAETHGAGFPAAAAAAGARHACQLRQQQLRILFQLLAPLATAATEWPGGSAPWLHP